VSKRTRNRSHAAFHGRFHRPAPLIHPPPRDRLCRADKVGYDRTPLLPSQVVEALWVAYGWRIAYGYNGPYVLFRPVAGLVDRGGWHTHHKAPTKRSLARTPAKADVPWSYAALNGALRRLEEVAGVEHMPLRATHGFRHYVVTEVHAATGNLALAGQYVGDRDIRTHARSYLRGRPEELRRVEHRALADRASNDHQTTTAARKEAAERELSASIAL
jgi:integrase